MGCLHSDIQNMVCACQPAVDPHPKIFTHSTFERGTVEIVGVVKLFPFIIIIVILMTLHLDCFAVIASSSRVCWDKTEDLHSALCMKLPWQLHSHPQRDESMKSVQRRYHWHIRERVEGQNWPLRDSWCHLLPIWGLTLNKNSVLDHGGMHQSNVEDCP